MALIHKPVKSPQEHVMKHSLAMAVAAKRMGKKMASGGLAKPLDSEDEDETMFAANQSSQIPPDEISPEAQMAFLAHGGEAQDQNESMHMMGDPKMIVMKILHAKKMADGGQAPQPPKDMSGPQVDPDKFKAIAAAAFGKKKMADGGMSDIEEDRKKVAQYGSKPAPAPSPSPSSEPKDLDLDPDKVKGFLVGFNRKKKMAEGGMVEEEQFHPELKENYGDDKDSEGMNMFAPESGEEEDPVMKRKGLLSKILGNIAMRHKQG